MARVSFGSVLPPSRDLADELRAAEGNVRRIFDKLGLADTAQDNRRVLAMLAFLRAQARGTRSVRGLAIRTG